MPRTFLTAEWRKLIMAQYPVDPAILAPSLLRGQCFVSLVGFLFDRVRVRGVAIPFHTRFEEVNLRFYVTRTEAGGTPKRGVVFVREFVPRAAITRIARSIYEEPYSTLPMRHHITSTPASAEPDSLAVEYAWRHRGHWYRLAVEAAPI